MMSSTTETDPFLQVQSEVLAQLTTTRPLFTSYLRILALSSTSPTPSPELTSARTELTNSLSTLSEDLSDLRLSIRAIQAAPSKYQLSPFEISRRSRLVDEIGGEVEDMLDELSKSPAAAAASLPPPSAFAEDDYAAEFEQQQQAHMMAEQDTQLESVYRTVGNLRQQANEMGRELEEQAEMLEVVDGLADRVGGRLQTGLKSMQTVIRQNEDGLSSCCIAVLIFVLILLLILVLIL